MTLNNPIAIMMLVVLGLCRPALGQEQERFVAGQHYSVLAQPVPVRDPSKIEVVTAFSYGCPPCYAIEPLITKWAQRLGGDVDFWRFPAVWNAPMEFYARTYYATQALGVEGRVHEPLFAAIVVEQKKLSNEAELAEFLSRYDVDESDFSEALNSSSVEQQARAAAQRVRAYNLASVPEIVVDGKYRVDRMRAGGLAEMFTVADFLIDKERGARGNASLPGNSD